jgi:nucleotide-binding universal stress UspA family protein
VPVAADFARDAGLELTVLQAVAPDDAVFDQERAQHYVDALARLHRQAGAGRVIPCSGRPAVALCEEAAAMDGAILTVASRGRGGPGRVHRRGEPTGSVTSEVIRCARTAVLVVPPAASLVLPGAW